jgi:hypothetical protein
LSVACFSQTVVMMLARASQVREQRWVLRPEASRPVQVRAMSDALV